MSLVKADPKPSYSTTQAETSGEAVVNRRKHYYRSSQPSLNFRCCHLLAPEARVLPGQRGPGAHAHSCCSRDAETQVLPGVLGAIAQKTDWKASGWGSLSCDWALTSFFHWQGRSRRRRLPSDDDRPPQNQAREVPVLCPSFFSPAQAAAGDGVGACELRVGEGGLSRTALDTRQQVSHPWDSFQV